MHGAKIYNLRIVPTNPVFKDVVNFKKDSISIFGKHPLSGSKPHITLASFIMLEDNEDLLIKALNQLSKTKKFNLIIQDFGVFSNNSNTLYLKVLDPNNSIEKIQLQLKIIWIRDLHRKLSGIKIINTPHITISKIPKDLLLTSLNYFGKHNYSKTFEVSRLILTSRYLNKTWDWQHEIDFS